MRQVVLYEGTLDNGYSDCHSNCINAYQYLYIVVFSNIVLSIVNKQIFCPVLHQRIMTGSTVSRCTQHLMWGAESIVETTKTC